MYCYTPLNDSEMSPSILTTGRLITDILNRIKDIFRGAVKIGKTQKKNTDREFKWLRK